MSCVGISYSRKRRTNFQTVQISKHKKCSCCLCPTHGPWESISIKFIMPKGAFFFGKKIDRVWADTANPVIPRFTYFVGSPKALRNTSQKSLSYIGQSQVTRSQGFTVVKNLNRFFRVIELCGCQSSS